MTGRPGRRSWVLAAVVFCVATTSIVFAHSPPGPLEFQVSVGLPAVERLVAKHVFTAGGKLHLQNPPTACHYVFLESPRISADGARLTLTAHASTRVAVEVMGNCIGPGDAFDVRISGLPFVSGTTVHLRDIRVDADSPLSGALATLAPTLEQRLRYDVERGLEELGPMKQGELMLGVASARVTRLWLAEGRLHIVLAARANLD